MLALIYDAVMSHVDYRTWAWYINEIISKWHPKSKNLIDISCGTATFLINLLSYNYNLYGFDHSFRMIARAKKKLEAKGLTTPIWLSNMTKYRLRNYIKYY